MLNYNDTYAHMNGRELDVLDFVQNASNRLEGNPKIRIYTGEGSIEEMLKNPKLVMAMLRMGRQQYAKGGVVGNPSLSAEELEYCRSFGRMGDDCIGIIGPRLKGMLDIWARHKGTTNPDTGCPEYFFLSNMFNSLGNGISKFGGMMGNGLMSAGQGLWGGLKSMASPFMGMAGAAMPALGQLAGTAIGSRFGPMGEQLGGQFGGMLGGLGGNAMNNMMSQQQPTQFDPYAQSAGHHFSQMAQNMYGGMSPQQAFGTGAGNFARENFGSSPVGMGIQGAANQFAQGGNPRDILAGGYEAAGGLAPTINAARNAYNNYMSGMNPQQIAGGFGGDMMRPMQQ